LHGTGVLGENLVQYPFFHHKSLIDCSRIETACALSALFCIYTYIYIFIYLFLFGSAAPIGPGLPHSRSF
jgi:hypothetical protein